MELEFIRDMFDGIARRYDLLNRLLSLRQDVHWRRKMVSALNLSQNDAVLDVACGTGDVIIEILKQCNCIQQVVGVDFSLRMLQIARKKLTAVRKGGAVRLIAGNGLHLPFPEKSFTAVTIAFGIRNIVDRKTAIRVFFDCLKPGGILAVLELTTPENRYLQSLYLLYFKRLLPKIGAFFSKHLKAYSYLPESVIGFPGAREFAGIMKEAGFKNIQWRHLTLGAATLFVGYKPTESIAQ
ncbi:MAG: bifunctional demethylmenaquinone methyltransferase/2-methoxy-6-polyprenyl-1,4-benzoquinol methylase UbiE [Desulfobacterales bacterium]|jgi:demethylmenaquinone methyltransferase/2-methoxy-6-polyprenyl-1,4-benzoquinol methylase|nr:bifunctional demethylmenaquinone methyltransferase/2-methoxy-6-polyprenyl-1,4-benzoquinol methylase UbiE [Desulfobacterales bacterium]